MRTHEKLHAKPKPTLTRLSVAIRIREAVSPALMDQKLFWLQAKGPVSFWIGESFLIASAQTPRFTSLEVWPFVNEGELTQFPGDADKVLNLHRLPNGSYKLVSFRRGDWEKDLLRYISAPLGLLTITQVITKEARPV
jgi:hypothetical protein